MVGALGGTVVTPLVGVVGRVGAQFWSPPDKPIRVSHEATARGPEALTSSPREHLESQITAADVHLSDDVLDRIDQIVAPGLTLNPADNGWGSPALDPTARRR